MRRTIVVGDVHGCAEELEALLDRVHHTSNDRVVFVGDLVARGPHTLRVLDIARRIDAVVVRGNHEHKLLAWRARKNAYARGVGERPSRLGRMHARIARSLSSADWTLLASSPVFYDLAEHGVRVVHAGVQPGVPFDEHDAETLMHIRYVTKRGEPKEKATGTKQRLWGARYVGAPHVVFGHNAMAKPQLHAWATGIDTACVYGGRLTALVLPAGQKMLRGDAARRLLVSVPARRVWFGADRLLRVA